jgi:hypothetical protein
MTFDEAITRLDAAGLWQEMLAFVEMEPLPAGALLFRDVTIADPNAAQLGGDSSGGAYVRLSDGAVLLIDSEGEYGVIGVDLRAALAHGLGCGGLYEALRFMGSADVEQARARWLAFRAQWNMVSDPPGDPAVQEIAAVLDLTLPDDPFASLHRAVWSTPPDFVRIGTDPLRRFGAAP